MNWSELLVIVAAGGFIWGVLSVLGRHAAEATWQVLVENGRTSHPPNSPNPNEKTERPQSRPRRYPPYGQPVGAKPEKPSGVPSVESTPTPPPSGNA